MPKTSAQTLISNLAKRVDRNGDDPPTRVLILRQLNESQQSILQDRSLRFMEDNGTITLLSAASSAAVPTTLDDGKTMALGRAAGDGELIYVPPDEWYTTHLDTYRMPTQTVPAYYTITQVAGVRTFLFKPGNTSGGNLSIPYVAQLVPVAMTDSSSSYSMLPEGFEDTLLLDHAEIEWRRFNGDPIQAAPQFMVARTEEKKTALYESYRTTKEVAKTDREQMQRKNAREVLAPEKP